MKEYALVQGYGWVGKNGLMMNCMEKPAELEEKPADFKFVQPRILHEFMWDRTRGSWVRN
jgi:hypothetical protein